jgi:hypothetical protein
LGLTEGQKYGGLKESVWYLQGKVGAIRMSLWEDVRLLIAQGEPDSALNSLETFLRGRLDGALRTRARDMLDIVLLLRAQGVRLAREQMQGVTSERDVETRRSRRDKQILDLLGEVERIDQLHPPTVLIDLPDHIGQYPMA